MESQTPHLQSSVQDGPGLVKRRRPALSCVECRKRKIKCDREKPCGSCTRTKSATCTYRQGQRANFQSTKTSAAASEDSSNQSSPQPVLGLQSRGPNSRLPSSGPDASALDLKSLLERVRELEGKVDSIKESVPSHPIPSSNPTGTFIKSKFFGESHWMNSIEPYEALGQENITTNPNTNRAEVNKSSELYNAVLGCKKMARTIKSARMLHMALPPEVLSSIPFKGVCDQLVQCYLRNFEGVLRVLHIPTFLKEYEQYWEDITRAKPSILVKILLVCAVGVAFYTGKDKARLRVSSTKWIQAAEYWLNAPYEKSRLDPTGIQIHILLLQARQICNVDGDLVWISAGALLRMAMHVGLHRDPSRFGKMSSYFAEMRRRLWATVLEMTVQFSLDMGMPPMITTQDYDTLPPSNMNDEDLSDLDSVSPDPRPPHELTQTSLQIALLESLPLRLKISWLINNLYSHGSYDDALRLGTQLSTICRSKLDFFQTHGTSSSLCNPFHIKILDTLARRFILSLHRPYSAKAKEDPKYYYSRKLCVDISIALMAPTSRQSPPNESQEDDWTRLQSLSVGFFKSIFLYSFTTIYHELLAQITEQQQQQQQRQVVAAAPTPPWDSSIATPPQFSTCTLRNVLVAMQQITLSRLRNGEANAKVLVLVECALARVDALASRAADPQQAILAAARSAVRASAELMRQAYRDEWDVDIDMDAEAQTWAGPDVDVDVEHGGLGAVLGGDGEAAVMGAVGVGFEDMEWDALMRDGGMELDFGFGLEALPGDWMFGGWEGGGEVYS